MYAIRSYALFLDEIGNLPLHLQPKLLTVLEQRKVTPVGANQPIPVDIRVIAATNMTPAMLRDERQFRQDLLFRLNTVEIDLPPLRDRREDVPALIDHYLSLYAERYKRPRPELSPQALGALVAHAARAQLSVTEQARELLTPDRPSTPQREVPGLF